jgi:3-oxoacyl-[acyl-carrier-protein] synthase II
LKYQISPPTINIQSQDIKNGCDLDYVKNKAREMKIKTVISNSFGFGGTNGTIIFKKL